MITKVVCSVRRGDVIEAILSKFKLLPVFALSSSLVSQRRITTKDIGSAYVSARRKVDKEVETKRREVVTYYP